MTAAKETRHVELSHQQLSALTEGEITAPIVGELEVVTFSESDLDISLGELAQGVEATLPSGVTVSA